MLGAANVGKSAFVRALVGEMSHFSSRHFDPAALRMNRRLPTESAMPGTTLRTIPIETFASGGELFGELPFLGLIHFSSFELPAMSNEFLVVLLGSDAA